MIASQKQEQRRTELPTRTQKSPTALGLATVPAKKGEGVTLAAQPSAQRSSQGQASSPLAKSFKGSPNANATSQKVRQMQQYKERMEQQRQNLSMLRVEGSRNFYGRQEQGRHGTQPVTAAKRRVQRVTAPGQTQTSPAVATATVRREKEGSAEEDFPKSGIKVTIESPNIGLLEGAPRGDSSAPTFTDLASGGYQRGPESRHGSKYLPAAREAVQDALREAQTDLQMDFGVLSPATLAEQTSRAMGMRRSKDGASACAGPQDPVRDPSELGPNAELEQAGLAVAFARREPGWFSAVGASGAGAGSSQPLQQEFQASGAPHSYAERLGPQMAPAVLREGVPTSVINPDLPPHVDENPRLLKSKNHDQQREGSQPPQGAPSRSKMNPMMVTRMKADSMLSKIVEVQAPRQQASRKQVKKRESVSRDELASSLVPPPDALSHQQLSKRQLRQLHEHHVLLRMQKQQLEATSPGTAVMVGGSDYAPFDFADAHDGLLMSQMAKLAILDAELGGSRQDSAARESGSKGPGSALDDRLGTFLLYQNEQFVQESQRLVPDATGRGPASSNQASLVGRGGSAGRVSLVEDFGLASAASGLRNVEARPTRQQSVGGVGIPPRNPPSASHPKGKQQNEDLTQSFPVVAGRLQPRPVAPAAEAERTEQARTTLEAATGPRSAASPAQLNVEIEATNLPRGYQALGSHDYGSAAGRRSGKNRVQDALMVQGRANRAGSSTSDYNLRASAARVHQKPQTADHPTAGRVMQKRLRNQQGGGLDRLSDTRGSMQYQNFQRQLQQIRSNKIWSNPAGKTLLAHQQRTAAQGTPAVSSTATTHFGSLSMGRAPPGTGTGKSRQGTHAKTNPYEGQRFSLIGDQTTPDAGHEPIKVDDRRPERPPASANAAGTGHRLQLRSEQPFSYHHSVHEQRMKNFSTSEDCDSMLTEKRAQVLHHDALDFPAEEVFGAAFKKSFSFLEQFDVKDIKQRIYARDGSLRDDGKPFFMEQQEKEKLVRANRTHKLRTNAVSTALRSNCRPLQGNYIHARMKTSQRHYEKCKGRLMTYFAHQLVYQKRASNSQMARREHRRPVPLLGQEHDSIVTVHGKYGRIGLPRGGDTTPEPVDLRALPTATKRTTGAGASSEGEPAGSDESRKAGAGTMTASGIGGAGRAHVPASRVDAGLLHGKGQVLAEGYKVLSTGVTVDVAAVRQEAAQSNCDPNSAVPNSANVKIVQRMYSDTGDSPKPDNGHQENTLGSMKLKDGELEDYGDSKRSNVSPLSKNSEKARRLPGGQPQDRRRSLGLDANTATMPADVDKERMAQRRLHSSEVDAHGNKVRKGATTGGQGAHQSDPLLAGKQKAPGTTVSDADPQPGQAARNTEASLWKTRRAGDSCTNTDQQSHQWMNSQNRVFEDFIIQTNTVNQQQYLPIQSKIQKLHGNAAGSYIGSVGLKTPAEILLYNNQHKHRATKLAGAQALGAAEVASSQPGNGSPTSQSQGLGNSTQPVTQSELVALQEHSKPLWVVQKAPQSKVVNYKSEAGHNLTKLSAGDPYKQYRLLEEHEKQRLRVSEKAATEQAPERRSSSSTGNQKPPAATQVKRTNSDINDVVEKKEARAASGHSRSLTSPDASRVPPNDPSSRSPEGQRVSYGLEAIRVGVDPRYLQKQRDAVKQQAMRRTDQRPFDNFNLNKRPQTEPDIALQGESDPGQGEQPAGGRHPARALQYDPKIPTAYHGETRNLRGQSVEDARQEGAGQGRAQAIVTANLQGKSRRNGAQRAASVDGEENLSALAPQIGLLQNARGFAGCESSLLRHPQSQETAHRLPDSPGRHGDQLPLGHVALADAYCTREGVLSEQAVETQRSRAPNFRDATSVGGDNMISRRTHGGTLGSTEERQAGATKRRLSSTVGMPLESRREGEIEDPGEATRSPAQEPSPKGMTDAHFATTEKANAKAALPVRRGPPGTREPLQEEQRMQGNEAHAPASSGANPGLRRLTAQFNALEREHELPDGIPSEPNRALEAVPATVAQPGLKTQSDHPQARRGSGVAPSNAVSKHRLESKASNSKIVYQTKKGDRSQQSQEQMRAGPPATRKVAAPSKHSIKNSTFMSDEDHLRRDNDSSVAGHAGRQLEKQFSEGVGFEHRSYGAGNVATYRNDDLNHSAHQEKLAKAVAPYMTAQAEKRLQRRGSGATAASQALRSRTKKYSAQQQVSLITNDEIGSVDLQHHHLNSRLHDVAVQDGVAESGRDAEMSAADLMADPRYTNQGLIIRQMKLSSGQASRGWPQRPKKQEQDDGLRKSKGTNAVATQLGLRKPPQVVEKATVEMSQSKQEKTGESFTASPQRGGVPMPAKNLVDSSPGAATSAERAQDGKLFQSKSQISSTIANDSPLVDQLIGKVSGSDVRISPSAKPIKDAEARITSTTPKSQQRPKETKKEEHESDALETKDEFKSATRSKSPVELLESAVSSRVIYELIPVDVGPRKRASLDERITQQAKEALAKKLRQPLHEAPPKYLQRQDMGTKYQFQIPNQRRRGSLLGQLQGEKAAGRNSLYSFGPQTEGNGHAPEEQLEPEYSMPGHEDASKRQATTAPLTRVVNSRHSSYIDEQTKLGNANVNIKNLCHQTKKARTQATDGSMLKPIGVIDEEQVLLREAVPELLLLRHEKSAHFYQKQLDNVDCTKAKRLVEREIDPNVRLDRSQLGHARRHDFVSVRSPRLDTANEQSQLGSKARNSQRGPSDEGHGSQIEGSRLKNARFTTQYDRGGKAGRVSVTQTRLGRSSQRPAALATSQIKAESQPGGQHPSIRSRTGTVQRRGSQPLEGERALPDHSKTGSIDSNCSGPPLNHTAMTFIATNRLDVPVLEPTLNANSHTNTHNGALPAAHEAAGTQRRPSANRRGEESALQASINTTGLNQVGHLQLACQVYSGPHAHAESLLAAPLFSPPDVVDVRSKARGAQNADLQPIQEARRTSGSASGVADQTLHMTLAESTIEHHRLSDPSSRDGHNKTDFKKGVHRDFRGLVQASQRGQGSAGPVGSLSPHSQTVRNLQGNRLLGKQKPAALTKNQQVHDKEKIVVMMGEAGVVKAVGSSLVDPGATLTAAPKDTNGAAQPPQLRSFRRVADLQPGGVARPEVDVSGQHPAAATNKMRASVEESRKAPLLHVDENEEGAAYGMPDARGYSSLEEDNIGKRERAFASDRRARTGLEQSFAPHGSRQHLAQVRAQGPEQAAKRDPRPKDGGVMLSTPLQYGSVTVHHGRQQPLRRSGTLGAAQAKQQRDRTGSIRHVPDKTQAVLHSSKLGQIESDRKTAQSALTNTIDERRLRELLGNRDLFSLPTTDVEDLLREVREHVSADVRDFGLLGYKAAIKPIDEVVKTSRSQDRSLVESRYGPKKPIQRFFKENRAEQHEKVRARCQEKQQRRRHCSRAPAYSPASPRQAATGIAGPADSPPFHEFKGQPQIPFVQEAALLAATAGQDHLLQAEMGTATNLSRVSSPGSNYDKNRIFSLHNPKKFTTEPL